jgi:hypothetical protein
MTRDTQLSKVYNAVRAAGHTLPRLTVPEIEAATLKALNSAWFQKRWDQAGTALLVKKVTIRQMQSSTYCQPRLTPMKRRANAKRQPYEIEFRVGPSDVTLVQVLHLATHLIHPGYVHDPAFCKEFLGVVGRFMGADAKKTVTESFRAWKVKHRVYSPEAREAARGRMIARQSIPDLLALRNELAGS